MAEQEVDWRFDIPPELSGSLVHSQQTGQLPGDQVEINQVEYSEIGEDNGDIPMDTLATPAGIQIIEQRLNTLVDGTQLIDVVIDIDPVYNATSYAVKIVKV